MTILLYYRGSSTAARKFDSTHTFLIKDCDLLITQGPRLVALYKIAEVWPPLLSDKTKSMQEVITKMVIKEGSEVLY